MTDKRPSVGRSWLRAITARLGIVAAALVVSTSALAQCTSGSLQGVLTPTATFQTVTVPAGGPSYYEFAATTGSTYTFTMCQGGGSAGGDDSYLTLANTTPTSIQVADDQCGAASELVWVATSTGTFRMYVSNFVCDPRPVDYTLAYKVVAPGGGGPVQSDLCSGAVAITCAQSPISGTTIGSTQDPIPCTLAGNGFNALQQAVWYKYVGDNQQVTVNTCALGYDTRITVFSGSCASLTCVGGNDDFCGLASQVTWNANTGTDYYIAIHGFGATATGNFTLTLTCTSLCLPLPANDDCALASPLTIGAPATQAAPTVRTPAPRATPLVLPPSPHCPMCSTPS